MAIVIVLVVAAAAAADAGAAAARDAAEMDWRNSMPHGRQWHCSLSAPRMSRPHPRPKSLLILNSAPTWLTLPDTDCSCQETLRMLMAEVEDAAE